MSDCPRNSPGSILEECKVNGVSDDLYKITRLVELIEGGTARQAKTRWATIQRKARTPLPVELHRRVWCVKGADLVTIVRRLAVSTKHLMLLAFLGEPVDDRICEVVLDADGGQVKLSVSMRLLGRLK